MTCRPGLEHQQHDLFRHPTQPTATQFPSGSLFTSAGTSRAVQTGPRGEYIPLQINWPDAAVVPYRVSRVHLSNCANRTNSSNGEHMTILMIPILAAGWVMPGDLSPGKVLQTQHKQSWHDA